MITAVYDPRWLRCDTDRGPVQALAFTLSRRSPQHTGELTPEQYRQIFRESCGKFGTTLDYARRTLVELRAHGIHDRQLERLLRLAPDGAPSGRYSGRSDAPPSTDKETRP